MKIIQFRKPKGKRYFGVWKEKLDAVTEYRSDTYDARESWLQLKAKIANQAESKKEKKKPVTWYAAAACLLIILTTTIILNNQPDNTNEMVTTPPVHKQDPVIKEQVKEQQPEVFDNSVQPLANNAVHPKKPIVVKKQVREIKIVPAEDPAVPAVIIAPLPVSIEPLPLAAATEVPEYHTNDLKKTHISSPVRKSNLVRGLIRQSDQVNIAGRNLEETADRTLIYKIN